MNIMPQLSNEHFKNLNFTNNTVFHAVYVPRENNKSSNDELHVYQDKIKALKVMKENKTGRLKTFKSYSEAEEYAKSGYEQTHFGTSSSLITITPLDFAVKFGLRDVVEVLVEEKSNKFKAPQPQDYVRFRKVIESGDVDAVKETVWTNPRYLISSGDTPAILKEGSRYNALHIAVISAKKEMCELILNTVQNTEFMQLLYGEGGTKSYLDRADIMLDLYLNMPDKGLNETPLHFAVKFGLRDIVEVLVSYPQCIKTVINKYNQMPIDMICSRKCQENEALKKEIRLLLEEDQYYVPVLRSEDNTLQPTIGEPFSPTSPLSLKSDPISPRVKVGGFAGPMTKSQALEFRKKWKTPPRRCITPVKKDTFNDSNNFNSPIENFTLRLQDTERGLECIGRNLAEEHQVPWKEYWPFLNDFANFRCADGLAKLEKYLEQRFAEQLYCKVKASNEASYAESNFETTDELESLCLKFESCSLFNKSDESDHNESMFNNLSVANYSNSEVISEESDDDELEFFTPPSSPILMRNHSEDNMYTAEEGCPIFIEGDAPTKIDHAVFNAVSSSIDRSMYPNIYRWKHEMELTMKRNLSSPKNVNTIRRKLLLTP